MCTCNLSHYDPCTSRNMTKKNMFWIFPQRVTDNLTIGLLYAWKRSASTLHFLLKGYILSLLDALGEENLWEQGNYSGFVPHSYTLEFESLCPFEQPLMLFPSLPLSCELAIDMDDWSGGGPSGGLGLSIPNRGADRVCQLYLCL